MTTAAFEFQRHHVFRQVGYTTHDPEIDRYHESGARIRILSAPNRIGKSYAAAHDALPHFFPPMVADLDERAYRDDGVISPRKIMPARQTYRHWIVAPDYALCKEFDYLFTYLVTDRKRYGWDYTIKSAQNNPANGNLRIHVLWGETPDGKQASSIIEGKSSNHEKGLQSEEVPRCTVSEAADQEERVFTQYLVPRVTYFDIPTTPKIKADWIKEMVESSDPNVEIFSPTPFANPHYDWLRFKIAALKAESRVGKANIYQWGSHIDAHRDQQGPEDERLYPGFYDHEDIFRVRCRDMSCAEQDPIFAETFLGLWSYDAERVIPFKWTPDANGICHVLDEVPHWVPYGRKYVSTDYGYQDVASAGFWSVGTDGVKVRCAEVREKRMAPEEFVRAIRSKAQALGWDGHITSYIGDPKKPEVEHYFRKLGMPVYAAQKHAMVDRKAGHMALVDALSVDPAVGTPTLFVLSDKCGAPYGCSGAIQEWKVLRAKGKVVDEYTPAAFIGEDGAFDDTRYFLMSSPMAAVAHPQKSEIEDLIAWNQRRMRRSGLGVTGGLRGYVPVGVQS